MASTRDMKMYSLRSMDAPWASFRADIQARLHGWPPQEMDGNLGQLLKAQGKLAEAEALEGRRE